MGELWRKASETLWARPLLWVPVLLADLLGSGLNLAQQWAVRAIVISRTEVHSVMGGAAQRGPLTASAVQGAVVYGVPILWLSYFLRILLYVVALVITSELVAEMMTRGERERTLLQTLRERVGGIFAVGMRALAVYAVMALVFSAVSAQLVKSGHKALLESPWFHTGATLLVLLLLVVVVAGSGLRLASGGTVSDAGETNARYLALLMGIVSLGLGSFIAQSARTLANAAPPTRIALEIAASLLTAIPFVLMFVGFGVLGKDEAEGRRRAAYEAAATD